MYCFVGIAHEVAVKGQNMLNFFLSLTDVWALQQEELRYTLYTQKDL